MGTVGGVEGAGVGLGTGSPYADRGDGCMIDDAGEADLVGMSREPRVVECPFV